MRAPTKEWRGHTWVGWLNLILLRWFFIRLAWETYENDFKEFKNKEPIGIEELPPDSIVVGVRQYEAFMEEIKKPRWTIIFRWPWKW
jgi:hypothetical protein